MSKNLENVKVGYTHCGDFHADDVFSVVLLKTLVPDIKIERVRQAPADTEDVIIFDIGSGEFDHHQKDAALRPNGTKYAAFGLLWKEFGRALCVDDTAFVQFDLEFVFPVDACDNGAALSTLSAAIGAMNPNWDEIPANPAEAKAYEDACFWRAVNTAKVFFDAKLARINSARKAENVVLSTPAIDNGRVVVFDRFVPWQNLICQRPDVLYVTHPGNRGGYFIQRTPDAPGSFGGVAEFPEEWRGYRIENEGKEGNPVLSEEDRKLGLTFCHIGGFCGSAKDKESALAVIHAALTRQFGE